MTERDFSRGLSMFNPDMYKDKKVGIIGAGGIGSNSAYALAKMGVKIKVCDFDKVDLVNTSSQFYSIEQVGMPKVEALKENILKMCNEDIEVIDGEFKPEDFEDCDILVLALDSLEVRKNVVLSSKDTQFILDTRMFKELSIVNTLYGFQRDTRMEKERREDADEIDQGTVCTEKAVAFNALCMGGLVGKLTSYYLNSLDNDLPPLKYSYVLDLSNMQLHCFNS